LGSWNLGSVRGAFGVSVQILIQFDLGSCPAPGMTRNLWHLPFDLCGPACRHEPATGPRTRLFQSLHEPASVLFVLKDGLPIIAARTATATPSESSTRSAPTRSRPDRNNIRNLTPPMFNAQGDAVLSFGRNSSAEFGKHGSLIAAPTSPPGRRSTASTGATRCSIRRKSQSCFPLIHSRSSI